MKSRLALLVLVLGVAACSSGSQTAAPRSSSPVAAGESAGDKAVCDAFQTLADRLTARDAAGGKAALEQLRSAVGAATTPALKQDATGLAQASDGATAAGFARKIPDDCKLAGQKLTHP